MFQTWMSEQMNRMQYWLIDRPVKYHNPSGFSGMEDVEFTEEKHAKTILHMIDSGMLNEDPRAASQRMHLVKIFPEREINFGNITPRMSSKIGNFMLIRGTNLAGVNQNWIKNDLPKLDFTTRINQLISLSSEDNINASLRNINSPSDVKNFINRRSVYIRDKLENSWKEFAKNQALGFIV